MIGLLAIGYADNIALHAVANFGVAGLIIFIALLSRILFSRGSSDRVGWTMSVLLLISVITTDVLNRLAACCSLALQRRRYGWMWALNASM